MFGIKALKKELQEVNDKLNKYEHDTRDKNALERKVSTLETDNHRFESEVAQLKIQIREQTEADIYFSCAKISKNLLDGEPKETLTQEINYRNSLMQQLQAQAPFSISQTLGATGAALANRQERLF